jgi:hypothetical protein
MPTRTFTATLAVMALLAAPALAQDFHWTGALAAGKRLEIKGVNGSIHATLASGAQAVVDARKTGRRSDPDEVKIVTVPFDGGVTICAVYPTGRRARTENGCEPGESWHSNTDDNDVTVDFTIQVPAGVIFSGETVNGDVDAQGLKGDTQVRTVNGSIDVSTSGTEVHARTVNGDMESDFPLTVTGKFGPRQLRGTIGNGGRELELETVNGSIRLRKAT